MCPSGHVGADVPDGDEVAFVEAMKMEIPVASPVAGKLIDPVGIDEPVAEGEVEESSKPGHRFNVDATIAVRSSWSGSSSRCCAFSARTSRCLKYSMPRHRTGSMQDFAEPKGGLHTQRWTSR